MRPRAWPTLPVWVRAVVRGFEVYFRAFWWTCPGFREAGAALRHLRETMTTEEWLQRQRDHEARGDGADDPEEG